MDESRVFVNGRTRDVIKQDIRSRIDRGDIQLERKEAIKVWTTRECLKSRA